jgi:ribonuclease HII
MKYPNFEEEKKLWKNDYKFVVGLDEAGRGPLAGPVTAAAVIFNYQFLIYNKFSIKQFSDINDSKKLSAKKREELYDVITKHENIKWGIGTVSEKVIDKINILEATKLAMQKALKNLKADYLLIDGNFTLRQAQGEKNIPQKSIVKGDQKVMSIAMASIIAKVTRDRIMEKSHKKYPQYGFNKHKGYGTELHIKMLHKFGPCKIHRKTFSYPQPNSLLAEQNKGKIT